jgi:dTDP-4-dehydrorhamnose reductase
MTNQFYLKNMKILILGGTGLVGSKFIDKFKDSFEFDSPSHNDLDLLNEKEVESYITSSNAEVIINCAAFTNVDAAEDETDDKDGAVYQLNSIVPGLLAKFSRETNKHLIHISTDYVFDGTKKDSAYTEEDQPNPLNWYAKTKYYGEVNVLEADSNATIVRIEMPYTASFDKKIDFARYFLEKFKSGENFQCVRDQRITPIFVDFCVNALTKLIEKKPAGIYHVASTDSVTPYEFATILARTANELKFSEKPFDPSLIMSIEFAQFNSGRRAPRPKNSWMSTQKFVSEFGEGILHTNEESIKEFLIQNPELPS